MTGPVDGGSQVRHSGRSARQRVGDLLPIPVPDAIRGLLVGSRNVAVYRLGRCRVLVSQDPPSWEWHLSISHPDRYPGWDEIAEARYRLLPPDETYGLLLPPEREYVNVQEHTFHLHRVGS